MQMPMGVPIPTVAINNATNAGLLALFLVLTGCFSVFGFLMDLAVNVIML
jgi:phosphoribosylcarboxyaminoimidazole (NCAIR) mutase